MSALRRHEFHAQIVQVQSPRFTTRDRYVAEKTRLRADILRHVAETEALKAAQNRVEEAEQEQKLRPIRVLEAALAVLETIH